MKSSLVLLLSLLFVFGSGCEREDPSQCSYWVKRLANPSKAREALQQVGMMKCADAGDSLKKMFEEGRNRKEVLAAAEQLQDKSVVVDLLKQALRIKDISRNAANMIRDLKLKEARPVLEEVLASGRNAEVRGPGLEALLSLTPNPKDVEGILLKILQADPSIQGAEATKIAAEALGKIRSEKAIPDLILALFAGTTDPALRSVYRVARGALASIGPAAAQPLADALNGKYKPLNDYVQAKQIPNWKWQWGPRLVEVLGDLRHEAGAQPIVEKVLARDSYGMWAGLSDTQRDEANPTYEPLRKEWNKEVARGFLMSALSLARIGSDDGVEKLASIIPNQPRRDWSQRTNAALALSLIGTDKAIDALIKAFQSEELSEGRANLLGFLSMGLGHKQMDAGWGPIEKDIKDRAKRISRKKPITQFQAYLDSKLNEPGAGDRIRAHINVVKDCGDKTGCYINKLKNSSDVYTKEKAAIILWRGKRDTDIFQAFFGAFKKMDPRKERDQRLFLIAGMGRIGTKKDAARVEAYLTELSHEGKVDPQWILELNSLHSFLRNLSS